MPGSGRRSGGWPRLFNGSSLHWHVWRRPFTLLSSVLVGLVSVEVALSQDPWVPSNGSALEFLFEAHLESYGDVKPFVLVDENVYPQYDFVMTRDLVAQGEGEFSGPGLNGTITWSQLNRKFPGMNHTSAQLIGFLEMDDGAEVMYHATGYAILLQTPDSTKWLYTTTLSFEEPDEPYEWLLDTDAVLVGEFDANSGNAHFWACVISEKADLNQ